MFQPRTTDASLFSNVARELEASQALNERMHAFFGRWHALSQGRDPRGVLDQGLLPWFAEMNAALHDALDDVAVRARLRENLQLLEGLAASIVERAVADGGDALRGDMRDLSRARLRPTLFAAA